MAELKYLWALTPVTPFRHHTFIRTIEDTFLFFQRNFGLITKHKRYRFTISTFSGVYTSVG